MSRLVAFVLVLVVLVGMNVVIHSRASRVLGLRRRGKGVLAGVLALGALVVIVGRAFRDVLSGEVSEALYVVGSAVELGVIIAFILLLPVEAGRAIAGIVGIVRRRLGRGRGDDAVAAGPAPDERIARETCADADEEPIAQPSGLGRRDFVANAATGTALVVGGGSSFYGALFGRHDYQIETVPIPIPGLARALDGYTIVQLSDIHFGSIVGEAERRAAVDLVRSARPDLIALTGDLLDHDAAFAPLLGALVRDIEPLARDGVVAIPGNHDHYAGVGAVLDTLRRGGARTLVNEGRTIGDAGGAFALLGVEDLWADNGGPDLDRAVSMVRPDLPRVLLCHQPAFFPESASKVALQLSGHTHGGQVNLFVRPADLVLPYGYVAGVYHRDGGTLYVNRGFGTAGPAARVDAPPEVTRIVLVAT